MQVDAALQDVAIATALAEYPQFAEFGPRIGYRALFQGGAWIVEYDHAPPESMPLRWEFLELAVTTYRRSAGV